jgi:prepilin-type N-terminal cleavage/methylation domain-containing protein
MKEIESMQVSTNRPNVRKSRWGFTLVELAVVVVIIGVLAAFGVPRFLQAVERSKASEAFAYLSAVRTAQERYLAREGTYAGVITDLDIQSPTPKYFSVGTITQSTAGTSLQDSWTLTLTRAGASAGYGPYTVIFTDQGFDSTNSTIPAAINPVATSSGSGS